MFPAHRKAGVYARRTAAISKPGKPGRSYRRKVRRDEGIPPYVCPEGRGRPVWPDACRGLRGRAMALPQNPAPPQGSRADASIGPYRGLL